MKRICMACAALTFEEKRLGLCHECKGLGYFETFSKPEGCTMEMPECPITYDPGIDGWECPKCGRSGPN